MRFEPHVAYAYAVRLQFEEAYARICAPAIAAQQQQPAERVLGGAPAEDVRAAPLGALSPPRAPLEPPPEPACSVGAGLEMPERDQSPERAESPRETVQLGRSARTPALPPPGSSAQSGRRAAAPRPAAAPRAPAASLEAPELPRRTRKRAAEAEAERVATTAVVDSRPRLWAAAEACAGPASPPPTAGFKPPAPGAQARPALSSPSSCGTAAAAQPAEAAAQPPPQPPPAATLPRRALLPVSPPAPAPPAPAPPAGVAAPPLLGSCSVCWEGIAVAAPPGSGAELCELRPCEHAYHAGCIEPWLAAQNTCPQCRVRVHARWGAARGLEPVAEADAFVQQLHLWTGRMPYDDTICQVCHDGGAEDVMLLCDGCDRGFHTHCVQLRCIPRGAWHCRRCRRAQNGPGAQLMQALAEQRRLSELRARASR